jgi:hypothetical protein
MRYRAYWDLATIPDDRLFAEAARRRSKKRLPLEVSPERREYLERNRIAVARYKAKKRARLAASAVAE